MDLTNVFRTTTIGSGIGTSFTGVPYDNNYPTAGLSEDRFSAQNSRLSLRVDSTVANAAVVGYVEADFLGPVTTSLNQTSNSATLRMRLYFVDVRRGKWEILAGQDWSMLTPNRVGIGFMPGDIFFSQDMDTNYQMGLVWERTPQFRFIYHPNDVVAAGISLENPEQYTGTAVAFPSNFSTSATQLDQGSSSAAGTPAIPNVLPDVVAKIAFDPKVGGRDFHVDIAGVFREFKINTFVSATTTSTNSSVSGGGVSFNSNLELFKNFHFIENAYYSDGGGRDIGNVGAPDVIVRPASTATGTFTLSPVHADSGILGFEYQVVPKLMVFGYYSAAYIGRDVASGVAGATATQNDSCAAASNGFAGLYPGGLCGYGVPGSANSNNRAIQEGTIGFIPVYWRNPNYGTLQMIVQGSYLTRSPWSFTNGTTGAEFSPTSAHDDMIWIDLRYVLP